MLHHAADRHLHLCKHVSGHDVYAEYVMHYDGTGSLSFVDAVAHTVHTKNTSHYLLRLKTTVDGRSICRIDQ